MEDENKEPKLFIGDLTLCDDPRVKPLIVECYPFVRRRQDARVNFVKHSIFGKFRQKGDPWPKSTEIECMHHCATFQTVPIPLVIRFEEETCTYHVNGVFCSVNCAKAYVIEHDSEISTRRMYELNHMVRNVFGIRGAIKPAPPRMRLRKFGGDLSIEEFCSNFQTVNTELLMAPFVPCQTVCAESTDGDQVMEDPANPHFKPKDPSMYAQFLAQHPPVDAPAPPPPKLPKTKRKASVERAAVQEPKPEKKPKLSKKQQQQQQQQPTQPKVDSGSLNAFLNFR